MVERVDGFKSDQYTASLSSDYITFLMALEALLHKAWAANCDHLSDQFRLFDRVR